MKLKNMHLFSLLNILPYLLEYSQGPIKVKINDIDMSTWVNWVPTSVLGKCTGLRDQKLLKTWLHFIQKDSLSEVSFSIWDNMGAYCTLKLCLFAAFHAGLSKLGTVTLLLVQVWGACVSCLTESKTTAVTQSKSARATLQFDYFYILSV